MIERLYLASSGATPSHPVGGWAFVLIRDGGSGDRPSGSEVDGSGAEAGGTGPRMDLRAAVEGLKIAGREVEIHTTSQLLADTGRTWLAQWKAAGWRKRGGIANIELVRILDRELATRTVSWEVGGDADAMGRARELARAIRDATEAPPPAEGVQGPPIAPSKRPLVMYTDGGCRGNPGGPGGWGCLLIDMRNGRARAMRGGAPDTTNNRMEMMGAIEGLQALKGGRRSVEIRSDSKYLIDTCTKWMAGWKRNGWTKKDGEPVKNLDLVQRLDTLLEEHDVAWTWVAGHSGEPGNEFVDALTNAAMDDVKKGASGAADQSFEHAPVPLPAGS